MSNSELLPTIDEIQTLLDEEYQAIEKEILQTKKKEQDKKDAVRIAELEEKLSH